jgi:hypothetical protein
MMDRPLTTRKRLSLERLEVRLALAGDLVISEFMAANSNSLQDADGDRSDWIEIHNPTTATIDLADWNLTDNAARPSKWAFPSVNLAPDARLVVFASEKDRSVAGSELHTNFKLGGDGEYLALMRPDGTVASEYSPTYPDQVPDISYGIGADYATTLAVGAGAAASVHVPTSNSLGTTWTAPGFNDANWNSTLARGLPTVVISEAGPGEPDFVEIRNVATSAIDTSGWVVAVSASPPGNPSAVNSTLWHLPASIASGQILVRTDNPANGYFGSDIAWTPGGSGWVMIVDDEGIVVDFAAWGYSAAELAGWNLTINGHAIGGETPVEIIDYEYEGNPAVAHSISGSYPDLLGTLLTDGNPGTSDWRTRFAGSQEPNSQGNSGRLQPRVTFDLGQTVNLRSVTITYMVDQSAGIHAPDSVNVVFGTGGLGGTFSGNITSTAFNNAIDSQPATFFGDVRTLTVDLGGTAANAVRLDFLNDREWTFLSEVSFTASSAATGWVGDGTATNATAGNSLQRQGTVDGGTAADFLWQPQSSGAANVGLTSPFPVPSVITGVGYEQATGFAGAYSTDLEAAMHGTNASVYVRVPFTVSPANTIAARLRMKYDGGFVAYLNGQEIARRNATTSPTWNSAALSERSDADALAFVTIDLPLTAPLPLGTNVLAIHGLNDSANSSSFLLVPELEVATIASTAETNVYFSTPTPGQPNSIGQAEITAAPEFSPESGVHAASFDLSISSPDPLAQIRYTLDGSEPTAAAALYMAPIAVNATTLVKARAFRDGQVPSPIRQGSYLRIDPALATRDSNVPLVVLDSMTQAIPTTSGSWASLAAALINTDSTGRAQITDVPEFVGRGGLHVRGSSSQAWPKKNYSFETWNTAGEDEDVSLFGMPAESDWVLYASYLDRTLLRDSLVHDLSNQMGNYSARTRPVEVYLNTGGGAIGEDDYLGVYIFVERIKQGNDRVDVAQLEPTDATEPDITGGYVLKIDRGTATIPAALSRDFVPADPEDAELTGAQRTWLTNYIAQFEAALSGPSFADPAVGYEKYIDVDAWIDYHIMTELTFNVDEWYLSTYLSKERGGKLTLGPFWDFDRSLGNTDQLGGAGTTGWYSDALVSFFAAYNGQPPDQVVEYPWFRRLFQDPNFYSRYVDRRTELRSSVLSEANIDATIDRLAAERLEAQVRNFQRWNTLGAVIAPSPLAFATYEEHVANLKTWIHGRLTWLDAQYVTAPQLSPSGGLTTPGTQVSMQVPGVPSYIDTTLVSETSTVRSFVPDDDSLGTSWTGGSEPFSDGKWTAGQNGVGYETSTGYGNLIHIAVPPATLSSYVRTTFNVSDPSAVDRLKLRMRFDDGFVAYINGVEVIRVNAPTALSHNSGATADHADSAAVDYQDFDITTLGAAAIRAGTNVLAIHGLNYLASSTDYLIQFELIASAEVPATPQSTPIYYTTDGSDPRLPNVSAVETLIGAGAPARARVPTSDIGTSWRNLGFDDSTWSAGTTGVGFEKNPLDSVNYTSLIGLDMRSQIDSMPGGANEFKSVYVRIPFTVANAEGVETLRLKMKYDDGFVAYLNGTKVAESRAPLTPLWNSQSTSPNPDASAITFEVFDITAFRGVLVSGDNLLAIHGMGSGVIDSDMLLLPELESVKTSGGISPTATMYAAPITIDESTQIIARSFDGARWSGATTGSYLFSPSSLRISELHYHPADPSLAEFEAGFFDADDFEFVELLNVSATDFVDLTGVEFTQGIEYTFAGGELAPGERIVIPANRAAFQFRHGALIAVAEEYGTTPEIYRFNNSGETVTLVGPVRETLVRFRYDDAWYVETDGEGNSLVTLDLSSAPPLDDPASWRASFTIGGSPGTHDHLPGDVDGNDRVNLLDLIVVQQNIGISAGATRAIGDLNGDGAVNRADVALLAMNFGRQYPPSAPSPAAAAVASAERDAQALRVAGIRVSTRRAGNVTLRALDVDRALDAEPSQISDGTAALSGRRALRRSPT